MSVTPGGEVEVWKWHMWSRLYSHFLRALLDWAQRRVFPDLNDSCAASNPVFEA